MLKNNLYNSYIIFIILMVINVDIAISAIPYYSTHYNEEDAIATQNMLRNRCSVAEGIFVFDYPPTKITQYNEIVWRFQWQCLVCETSSAAIVILEQEKKKCLNNCLDDSVVRCIDEGDTGFSISECGEPIQDDPRYPQCKNSMESSSSNQNNNSSSSELSSNSNISSCSSSEDISSSSYDDDSSSSSMDDSDDDDNDSDLCFSSIGEALVSNSIRSAECTVSGGDASGLEVVPHSEEYLWCLVGDCEDISSSSDGSGSSSSTFLTCFPTHNEAFDHRTSLYGSCYDSGGAPDYDDMQIGDVFCVIGRCYPKNVPSGCYDMNHFDAVIADSIARCNNRSMTNDYYMDVKYVAASSDYNYAVYCLEGSCFPSNYQLVSYYQLRTYHHNWFTTGTWDYYYVNKTINGVDYDYKIAAPLDASGSSIISNFLSTYNRYHPFGSPSFFSTQVSGDYSSTNSCTDFYYLVYYDYQYVDLNSPYYSHLSTAVIPDSLLSSYSNYYSNKRYLCSDGSFVNGNFYPSSCANAYEKWVHACDSLRNLNKSSSSAGFSDDYCRDYPDSPICKSQYDDYSSASIDEGYNGESDSNSSVSNFSSFNAYSSSVMDVYEYCLDNPTDPFCINEPENNLNSSSSKSTNEPSSSSNGGFSSGSNNNYSEECLTCKPFIAGSDASYTPEDVFTIGLYNMKPGKCYGLNPDRGTQHGWINNNAADEWWWREVPCDGSILIEFVTPNGCKENKRGQNAVYTANDCFSDGLDNMEQGKCYALNPDRGTQYGWINNNAQDRWWWKEVACGSESGDSNGCPENFSPLFKKSIFNDSSDDSDKNASHEIWGNKTQFFYDALGRKTQAKPETRRYLFEPKRNKTEAYNINREFGIGTIEIQSIRCYRANNEKLVCEEISQLSVMKKDVSDICGIKGEDYAYMKNDGTLVGGYTCTFIEIDFSPKNYNWVTCSYDRSKIQIDFNINFTTTLTINEPFSVKEGDTFRNSDYIATKEDEIAMHYHELGHVKYNSCLKFPIITKRISGCYCNEEEIKEKIRQEINEVEQKYGKLLSDMNNLFHEKYGATGYATTYTCPN